MAHIFKPGTKVWVRNPYGGDDDLYRDEWLPAQASGRPLWVPAEVTGTTLEYGGMEVSVLTTLTPRLALTVYASELLPMNPVTGLDDMGDFAYLHEAGVLYNVARRYLEDRTATRAGAVMLAVNPCKPVLNADGVSLLDPVYMARYRARIPAQVMDALPASRRALLTLPPHVYEVADAALNACTRDFAPQSIVLLGASGSGKSEALKAMLQYLVCVPGLEAQGVRPGMLALMLEPKHAASTARAVRAAVVRPPLLTAPDVADARADAQRRSGPLGSSRNPFVSQYEWGNTQSAAAAFVQAHVAPAADATPGRPGTKLTVSLASPPGARAPGHVSTRADYAFLPDLSNGPSAAALAALGGPGGESAGSSTSIHPGSDACIAIGASTPAVGKALLAATVVLDAFTCAHTPSSPHSSRALRITKLYYGGDGALVGGALSVAALDLARVTGLAWDQSLPTDWAAELAAMAAPGSGAGPVGDILGLSSPGGSTSRPGLALPAPVAAASHPGKATPHPFGRGRNFHVLHRLAAGAPASLRQELGLLPHDAYTLLTGTNAFPVVTTTAASVGGLASPRSMRFTGPATGGATSRDLYAGGLDAFALRSPGGAAALGFSTPLPGPVNPAVAAANAAAEELVATATAEFAALSAAMLEAGFSPAQRTLVYRILAAILTLGNVRIDEVPAPAGGAAASPASGTAPGPGSAVLPPASEALAFRAADLLGTDRRAFTDSLTKKNRGFVSSGGAAEAAASPSGAAVVWTWKRAADARAGVSSLIAFLYSRLVAWMVATMNSHLVTLGGAAYAAAAAGAAGATPTATTNEPPYVALVDGLGAEGTLHPTAPAPSSLKASQWPAVALTCGLGSPNAPLSFGASSATAVRSCFAGLDTLARNYAAERLHELFVSAVFRAELATYALERIEAPHVPFDDNAGAVALVDNRRTGVLSALNELCSFPRSSDATFVAKLHALHHNRGDGFSRPADAPEVAAPAGTPGHGHTATGVGASPSSDAAALLFSINHSSGVVPYSASGWLAFNKDSDRADADTTAVVARSAFAVVREVVATPAGAAFATAVGGVPLSLLAPSATAPAGTATLMATRWMDELAAVLEPLAVTAPHFVRCLRPNATLTPSYVDPALMHAEIAASGSIQAIALRHAGYPYRTTYADFYARFIILAQQRGSLVFPPPPGVPVRELARELLSQLVSHPAFAGVDLRHVAQFGATKIFLRRHLIDALEALREKRLAAMDGMAVRIQAAWRGHAVRRDVRALFDGLRRVQATWRTLHARAMWLHTRAAAVRIQSAWRRNRAIAGFKRIMSAVRVVQRLIRRYQNRKTWAAWRQGVRRLHALSRGFVVRCHVMRMIYAATAIQAATRGFLVRSRVAAIRNAAAARFQAAWRAHKFRLDNEDILQFLSWKRGQRARASAATAIQAAWRGYVIRCRFLELLGAACFIQSWVHTKLTRARYLLLRRATIQLQAAVRGFLARQITRRVRTLQLLADEVWRLALIREREGIEIARGHHAEALAAFAAGGNAAGIDANGVSLGGSTSSSTHASGAGSNAVVGLGVNSAIVRPRAPAIFGVPSAPPTQVNQAGNAVYGAPVPAPAPSTNAPVSGAVMLLSPTASVRDTLLMTQVHPGNAGPAAGGIVNATSRGFGTTATPTPAVATHPTLSQSSTTAALLDVDVSADLSEVYPSGWSHAFNGLERELRTHGTRVASVALGSTHTLVLSEAGHVYAWGLADQGQTGLGALTASATVPRLVSALLTDKHLSTALAGAGKEGAGAQSKDQTPAPPVVFKSPTKGAAPGAAPATPVLFSPGRGVATAIRIRSIAAGDTHSLAVSDSGVLYAWGSNRRGQLGLGSWVPATTVPTPVRLLPASPDGPSPGLGASSLDLSSPVAAAALDPASPSTVLKVVEVAAGVGHSVALTASGVIYTCGTALCLGNGPAEPAAPGSPPSIHDGEGNQCVFLPVRALAKHRTRHVASGPDFVAVVTAAGDVYTWGAGTDGQLGVGEDVYKRRVPGQRRGEPPAFEFVVGAFRDRTLPTLVDGLLSYEKHSRIAAIACGANHCVAVSSTGRVFTWGSNSHGQLGLGVIGEVPAAVLKDHGVIPPTLPLSTASGSFARRSPAAAPVAKGADVPHPGFGGSAHRMRDRSVPVPDMLALAVVGGEGGADDAASVAGSAVGGVSEYCPRSHVASPVMLRALETRHVVAVAGGRRSCTVLTDTHDVLAWGCTLASRKYGLARALAVQAGLKRGPPALTDLLPPSSPAAAAALAAATPRMATPGRYDIHVPVPATEASAAAAGRAGSASKQAQAPVQGRYGAAAAAAASSPARSGALVPATPSHAPASAPLPTASLSDAIATSLTLVPTPTEVSVLSEVPGRVCRRIFGAHARGLSVSLASFTQPPISANALKELVTSRAFQTGIDGLEAVTTGPSPSAAPDLLVRTLLGVAAEAVVAAAPSPQGKAAAAATAAPPKRARALPPPPPPPAATGLSLSASTTGSLAPVIRGRDVRKQVIAGLFGGVLPSDSEDSDGGGSSALVLVAPSATGSADSSATKAAAVARSALAFPAPAPASAGGLSSRSVGSSSSAAAAANSPLEAIGYALGLDAAAATAAAKWAAAAHRAGGRRAVGALPPSELARLAADLVSAPRIAAALLSLSPSRLGHLTAHQLSVLVARLYRLSRGEAAAVAAAGEEGGAAHVSAGGLSVAPPPAACATTELLPVLQGEAAQRSRLLAVNDALMAAPGPTTHRRRGSSAAAAGALTRGAPGSPSAAAAAASRAPPPVPGEGDETPVLLSLAFRRRRGLLPTSGRHRLAAAAREDAVATASRNKAAVDAAALFARHLLLGAASDRVIIRRDPIPAPATAATTAAADALLCAASGAGTRAERIAAVLGAGVELKQAIDALEADTAKLIADATLELETGAVAAETAAKTRTLVRNIRLGVEAAVQRPVESPPRRFADLADVALAPMREYVSAVLRDEEEAGKPYDPNAPVAQVIMAAGGAPEEVVPHAAGHTGFPFAAGGGAPIPAPDEEYLPKGPSVRELLGSPSAPAAPVSAPPAAVEDAAAAAVPAVEVAEVAALAVDAAKASSTAPLTAATMEGVSDKVSDLRAQLAAARNKSKELLGETSGLLGLPSPSRPAPPATSPAKKAPAVDAADVSAAVMLPAFAAVATSFKVRLEAEALNPLASVGPPGPLFPEVAAFKTQGVAPTSPSSRPTFGAPSFTNLLATLRAENLAAWEEDGDASSKP